MKEIQSTLKDYQGKSNGIIADALKKAKGDTIPQVVSVGTGQGGFTTVKLSKEGMQEIVNSFEWQKNFVQKTNAGMLKTVRDISKERYASHYDLRKKINREFRIDRDKTISLFHRDVEEIANQVISKKITAAEFEQRMKNSIDKHYPNLYREGKGIIKLDKWEEKFIENQAKSQDKYLANFREYIERQQTLGNELTGRITQRAHLYAERGTALFEAGHIASLPDDVLLDWKMQPAEHCPTCPIYEIGSPYTKETLPGLPGEGFNITRCGTNCQCIIQVSEFYVTKTPDVEKDLAIKIVSTGKPVSIALPKQIQQVTTVTKAKVPDFKPTEIITGEKYLPPEEVRKKMDVFYKTKREELALHKKEMERLKVELVDIRMRHESIIDAYNDPDYKNCERRLRNTSDLIKNAAEDAARGARKFVEANENGFGISCLKNVSGNTSVFESNMNKSLMEFSKLVDESMVVSKKIDARMIKDFDRPFRSGTSICIDKYASADQVIHEMGHILEFENRDMHEAAREFFEMRTKGEKAISLNEAKKTTGFGSDEVTKKDEFIDSYMGKIYSSGNTELISMGLQQMYTDPYKLATKDPEMFDWLYKLVRGVK